MQSKMGDGWNVNEVELGWNSQHGLRRMQFQKETAERKQEKEGWQNLLKIRIYAIVGSN